MELVRSILFVLSKNRCSLERRRVKNSWSFLYKQFLPDTNVLIQFRTNFYYREDKNVFPIFSEPITERAPRRRIGQLHSDSGKRAETHVRRFPRHRHRDEDHAILHTAG